MSSIVSEFACFVSGKLDSPEPWQGEWQGKVRVSCVLQQQEQTTSSDPVTIDVAETTTNYDSEEATTKVDRITTLVSSANSETTTFSDIVVEDALEITTLY